MIEWWWLAVEAIAFLLFCSYMRGVTRAVALVDACSNRERAVQEILRRWGQDNTPLNREAFDLATDAHEYSS